MVWHGSSAETCNSCTKAGSPVLDALQAGIVLSKHLMLFLNFGSTLNWCYLALNPSHGEELAGSLLQLAGSFLLWL
jgi:hypothetical protein